jgi:hypothetical protein
MNIVNPMLTMYAARMNGKAANAGGVFLTLSILGGMVAGVIAGNTMAGVLLGTGAGIVLAVLTWLVDRRPR